MTDSRDGVVCVVLDWVLAHRPVPPLGGGATTAGHLGQVDHHASLQRLLQAHSETLQCILQSLQSLTLYRSFFLLS